MNRAGAFAARIFPAAHAPTSGVAPIARHIGFGWLALLLAALWCPGIAPAQTPPATAMAPIGLQVDLRRAPERIIAVREQIPVRAGRVTLRYPEWVPGKHAPEGPVANVAGLMIEANGKRLAWRRDLRDMYSLHVEVPEGVERLNLAFQYFPPRRHEDAGVSPSTTDAMAVLEFNQVLFYPAGHAVQALIVEPAVTLPRGWRFASALATVRTAGTTVTFAPLPLSELVDSPLLCGRYLQTVELGRPGGLPVRLNIAREHARRAPLKQERLAGLERLGRQTWRLFGAAPYRHYDFLLALSDELGFSTLGHRQSSDNRLGADFLSSDASFRLLVPLLAHEWLHAWNGNFRRPDGLVASDYSTARETDLLWLEEGLTDYWSAVLAARAGLWSPAYFRAMLASTADLVANRSGRQWRSLQDTADAAQLAWRGSHGWNNWRRGADFHPEGLLLWLDVDTRIRELSGNRRSLDDFARAFFGAALPDGAPTAYDFDAIVEALNAVEPADWSGFLRARLDYTGPDVPYRGLARAGWALAWGAQPSVRDEDLRELGYGLDLMASAGFSVSAHARVRDVAWKGPAAAAGVVPGMKIIAVNEREFSLDGLIHAVGETRAAGAPLTLLVREQDRYRDVRIDYHGGLRRARLARIEGRPDRLADIIKPLPKEPSP